MHEIVVKTDPQDFAKLKRELITYCGRYGAIGVVEALSEVAGDFSGRQGELFKGESPDDGVRMFGKTKTEVKTEWVAAWAILSKCADELRGVFGG